MIGESIHHYKILEQIGEGGMGVVYRAHDTKLDRTVALKFLPPGRLTSKEEKARFIREARTASSLDHPNVGTIFDIQETDDGQTFIVMAHYPGESLRDRLSRGPLPIEVAVDMARQIAEGLSAAHTNKILHRDIKPDNVLVTDSGLLKVVDFGLARDLEATALTRDNQLLGTAAYMSPEQAQGKPASVHTDVWALGVVLFELLTREHPFQGDYAEALLYQVVNETPRAIKQLREDIPSALVSIVERALAKDPGDRFATAGEMRDALVACLGTVQSRTPRRNRAVTMVVIIAAIAVLGWIGLQILRPGSDESDIRAYLHTEVRQLIGDAKDTEAFFLLESEKQIVAADPALVELLNQCSREVSIDIVPEGATVYFKDYLDTAGSWVLLGTTPVRGERLPFSYLRLRLVKEGYQTREMSFRGIWGTFRAQLFAQEDAIEGMIHVPTARLLDGHLRSDQQGVPGVCRCGWVS
jgi:serine/threonine protein kinase